MLTAAPLDVTQLRSKHRDDGRLPATRVGRRGCAGTVPLRQPGSGKHRAGVHGRALWCSSTRAPASRVAVKRQPGAPGLLAPWARVTDLLA